MNVVKLEYLPMSSIFQPSMTLASFRREVSTLSYLCMLWYPTQVLLI